MDLFLLLRFVIATTTLVGTCSAAEPIEFELYTAEEIAETVDRWKTHYSQFLYVSTAQEDYRLSTAGESNDCPFDADVTGCLNRFLILNPDDRSVATARAHDSAVLPQVLWSGELHGNERVGPTAVMEATQLLLAAVECHQLPRWELQGQDRQSYEMELLGAQACRADLAGTYDLQPDELAWLARLYHTRRLVVVPTANALGYFRNTREEDFGVDPNRDFPYDTTKDQCMKTIAARTLNELYQDHLIQLSLTFHGGMEVIGYEWGAPSYTKTTSPDDTAEREIAQYYSKRAGGFDGTPPYRFGPMNDLVYPVNGGMEDWAYAASWDPNRTVACEPTSYGGYETSRTKYDEYVLRCFNMLVETSNSKIPKSNLGTSKQLLAETAGSNGHVTRNVRLALAALEMVQPFVYIDTVNDVKLVNDDWTCRHVQLPSPSSLRGEIVNFRWKVGGSIRVNDVQLYHRRWSSELSKQYCKSYSAVMEMKELEGDWKNGTIVSSSSSTSGSIDVSEYSTSDEIAVIVRVRVDQSWTGKSHITNARTNPDYRADHNGYVIQGRRDWYSVPLLLHIGGGATTEELYVRYDPNNVPAASGSDETTPSDENSTKSPRQYPGADSTFHDNDGADASASIAGTPLHRPSSGSTIVSWVVVAILVIAIGGWISQRIVRSVMRQSRREQVRNFIYDKTAVPPGLNGYEDVPTDAGDADLPQIA